MRKQGLIAFCLSALALAACGEGLHEDVEVRSIPSEAMSPALVIGDRVGVNKSAYTDGKTPERGDIVIFQHPHNPRVMVKRAVGLPGDVVQMRNGLLFLNDAEIPRTLVRTLAYQQDGGFIVHATEYEEQFPGEAKPHRIFNYSDAEALDATPAFTVPAGHFFLIGDNRDNSEDSRAPTGHRELAARSPDEWPYNGVNLGGRPEDDAIGFVAQELLIGRAMSVLLNLGGCRLAADAKAAGVECLQSKSGPL